MLRDNTGTTTPTSVFACTRLSLTNNPTHTTNNKHRWFYMARTESTLLRSWRPFATVTRRARYTQRHGTSFVGSARSGANKTPTRRRLCRRRRRRRRRCGERVHRRWCVTDLALSRPAEVAEEAGRFTRCSWTPVASTLVGLLVCWLVGWLVGFGWSASWLARSGVVVPKNKDEYARC